MAKRGRTKSPRREVLRLAVKGAVGTLGLASLYVAWRFLEPVAADGARGTAVVGKVETFPPGTARTALLDERPILVIREPDGTFRAFVALCTHLHCVVHYVAERDWIECSCHGGRFSTKGRNMVGPPRRPLEALDVEVLDGTVVVKAV